MTEEDQAYQQWFNPLVRDADSEMYGKAFLDHWEAEEKGEVKHWTNKPVVDAETNYHVKSHLRYDIATRSTFLPWLAVGETISSSPELQRLLNYVLSECWVMSSFVMNRRSELPVQKRGFFTAKDKTNMIEELHSVGLEEEWAMFDGVSERTTRYKCMANLPFNLGRSKIHTSDPHTIILFFVDVYDHPGWLYKGKGWVQGAPDPYTRLVTIYPSPNKGVLDTMRDTPKVPPYPRVLRSWPEHLVAKIEHYFNDCRLRVPVEVEREMFEMTEEEEDEEYIGELLRDQDSDFCELYWWVSDYEMRVKKAHGYGPVVADWD